MTDTNAADLMPCPFCAATPQIVKRDVEPQNDSWYGKKVEEFVLCECGACLFDGSFHEGFWEAETRAAAAWNRRTPIPRDPVGEHKAGFTAAIELAAQVCDEQAKLPECPERARYCAEGIRALAKEAS